MTKPLRTPSTASPTRHRQLSRQPRGLSRADGPRRRSSGEPWNSVLFEPCACLCWSGGGQAGDQRSTRPNLGLVTAYNDMLSAHAPYYRYPERMKVWAREAGATLQFAGGSPAMCDGVTQGEAGMELSLFSRDTIALSTAIALSHEVRRGRPARHLRQDRSRLADGRASFRPCPPRLRSRGSHELGHFEQGKAATGNSTPKARRAGMNCWRARWGAITRRAHAPFTVRPIRTR